MVRPASLTRNYWPAPAGESDMPLILATPEQLTQQIDAISITFHGINHQTGDGVIIYSRGYTDQTSGDFVGVTDGHQLALSPLEVQQMLTRADELLAGGIYAAEKQALYEHLSGRIGLTGTIA